MTPAERSLRSRLGGLTTAARGHVNTVPARAAYALSDHADCVACGQPGPIPADIGPEHRAQIIQARQRLHMSAIAYRSVRSRAKKKARPDRDSGRASSTESSSNAHQSTS